MSETQTFSIEISSDSLETKNKALGSIIRKARALISQTEIPGTLEEFWDETPLSTIQIRELFWMSRAMFAHHFNNFKEYMLKNHNKQIIPLIEGKNWPDVYSKWIVREFLVYLNRNKDKYQIIL